MADGEPDRPARDRERLGLVDIGRPRGREVVHGDQHEERTRAHEPRVARGDPPGECTCTRDREDGPGHAAATDVREEVRADVRRDVEVRGELVAFLAVAPRPEPTRARRSEADRAWR